MSSSGRIFLLIWNICWNLVKSHCHHVKKILFWPTLFLFQLLHAAELSADDSSYHDPYGGLRDHQCTLNNNENDFSILQY